MVDQFNGFASEVTRMAREVGTEGRLGGQAQVPGVGGTWKDLTDNVNLLAANLTTQVRAIAEVTTAVTKGDLTRSIQVDARGEVADLKDYINAMIGNLRATTDRNTEQDWLKTNLAKFSGMMQGQRDLLTLAQMLLSELAPLVNAQQGVIYVIDNSDGRMSRCASSLATPTSGRAAPLRLGEGLVGQCAVERQRLLLTDVPTDSIESARVFSWPSRATSWCCRCCSKARSRPSSSSHRCVNSLRRTSLSSSNSPALSASCSIPLKRRCAPKAC